MNRRLSYSEAAPAVYDREPLVRRERRTPVYSRVGSAVLAIVALGNQPAKPQATNSFDGFALVDKSGNIRKPTNYRDVYQTLGTYFVLDPKAGESDAPNLRIAGSRRILPA